MTKTVFINLPVTDLPRSMAFYEAVGFTNNPHFTDETAACMVWSETIMVMLLTNDRWQGFTARPIPTSTHSEVMLALSFDSKDEVNGFVEAGSAAGGSADLNPPQDHGFMFQRTLGDPDGHIWEPFWMDPQAANAEHTD
jgi:uncharacterized protein